MHVLLTRPPPPLLSPPSLPSPSSFSHLRPAGLGKHGILRTCVWCPRADRGGKVLRKRLLQLRKLSEFSQDAMDDFGADDNVVCVC